MAENRAHPRLKFTQDLTVYAAGPLGMKKIEYFGRGFDISLGGILFASIAQFAPSAACTIKLKGRDGSQLEMSGKILRVTGSNADLAANESVFALQFDRELSDAELMNVLPGE